MKYRSITTFITVLLPLVSLAVTCEYCARTTGPTEEETGPIYCQKMVYSNPAPYCVSRDVSAEMALLLPRECFFVEGDYVEITWTLYGRSFDGSACFGEYQIVDEGEFLEPDCTDRGLCMILA